MKSHPIQILKAQNQLINLVERKLDWFFEELVEFINQEEANLADNGQ
ncbi:MAG TPA: hypothetical protein PLY70_19860 [Saprospiraceae bacterium]|nr:hypothetical protein [Saprospiraceae bacterium]